MSRWKLTDKQLYSKAGKFKIAFSNPVVVRFPSSPHAENDVIDDDCMNEYRAAGRAS